MWWKMASTKAKGENMVHLSAKSEKANVDQNMSCNTKATTEVMVVEGDGVMVTALLHRCLWQ